MTTRRMAISRAAVAIGATLTLVAGATFANLTSTATLTNNTLATATADLQVDTGSGFGSSAQGFMLTNVVPGVNTTPFAFDLKNNGGVALAVTAHVPVAPTYSNFTDFNKVEVKIQKIDNSPVVDTTLADLINGNVSIATINAAATNNYQVVVNVHADAVTGSAAQINAFDIVFTGTQP